MSDGAGARGGRRRPLRVLHTSDVHLGAYDRGSGRDSGDLREAVEANFRAVIDVGLRERVDLVLIAGDFFDNARVNEETLRFAAEQIARAEVPVVIGPGNHDHVGDGSVYDRLDLTAVAPDLHILRDRAGAIAELAHLDIEVWGRSHVEDGREFLPFAGAPGRNGAAWHLAIGHGHYVQEEWSTHPSYHIREHELSALDHDYVALGHWDRQLRVNAGSTLAAYSGAPDGIGGAHGRVLVVDLEPDGAVRLTSHSLGDGPPIAHDDIPLLGRDIH